jgi:hypothetical protein
MTADDFIEQVSRVRARFASTLSGKIADLEKMSDGGGDAIETVIATHCRLHEMYGIAQTLGFPATGQAAGAARTAIREAAKAKRAATPAEIVALKTEIERLRVAATGELQNFRERVSEP